MLFYFILLIILLFFPRSSRDPHLPQQPNKSKGSAENLDHRVKNYPIDTSCPQREINCYKAY